MREVREQSPPEPPATAPPAITVPACWGAAPLVASSKQDDPKGFDHCELALQAAIFEASHTYKVKGTVSFLSSLSARFGLSWKWMPAMDANLESEKCDMLRFHLRDRGIRDERVLAAMAKVPRERFIGSALRRDAYADHPLPIDCGQTISQPYIVALMTEVAALAGDERVLEIGTGSGYQTAILAELAGEVVSIERHAALARGAGAVLADLGYTNTTLIVGDGTLGWPAAAPYDRILVTAAAARVPPALFDQLAEGGILVIPTGGLDMQMLATVRRANGQPQHRALCGCRFVPLVGAQAWPEPR